MEALLIGILVALIVGLLGPFFLRPLLLRLKVLDKPTERSSHVGIVLRGAGLVPLSAMIIGILSAIILGIDEGFVTLVVFTFLMLAVGALGWIEDLHGLPVKIRAGMQLVFGVFLGIFFCWQFSLSWWWVLPVALLFAGYVNSANFMDGINGISSLHGTFTGIFFAAIGWLHDYDWAVLIGLVLAASFISFFPWNLKGKLFLGDVGSYLLGGTVAFLALGLFFSGVNPFLVVSPLVIYLADTILTIIKRFARGEKWYEAHREHVYQQLTPRYFTHLLTACVVTLFSMAAAGFALFIELSDAQYKWLMMILGVLIVVVMYLMLPRLLAFVTRSVSTSNE